MAVKDLLDRSLSLAVYTNFACVHSEGSGL